MKKLFTVAALVFLACSGFPVHTGALNSHGPSNLRIGAFNIRIFGVTKLRQRNTLTVLARIATNFDVMAVEEVGSNGSKASDETCVKIMDAYVARINEVSGGKIYSYVRGDQYAIVYRNDRVRINDYGLYGGTEPFKYTPLVANMSSIQEGANFDFSMVVIHTSPGLAEEEIPALKTVMEEVAELFSEPDVICAGDYNADGSYYDEGGGEWLSGFDPGSYITGIANSCDTTVADSSNTYDRIQMTISLSTDYTGNFGVFRYGGVYDLSECEGTAKTAGTEDAVSDHYPVWCEFYADRDED